MRGSFASLPSLQCSSKPCHTPSLVTSDFFWSAFTNRRVDTLYTLDTLTHIPEHQEITPCVYLHCLMCWSLQQLCPFPSTLAHNSHSTAQCDRYCESQGQTQNQTVTHSIQYKIKLITKHCSSQEAALLCRCALYIVRKGTLQYQELQDSRKKIIPFTCDGCLSLDRSD